MYSYYFRLGVRSLRRNPALTLLMLLTLAVGVAASISTLTVVHVLSGDPIPAKSAKLLVPQIDNGPVAGYTGTQEPKDLQMSYTDAANLLRSGQGRRRTAMYGVTLPIESPRKDLPAFNATGLASTRDFFAMFDVPFLYGQPWSKADDDKGADVVVLGRATAQRLFGNNNPVGMQVTQRSTPYIVVGVVDTWAPLPRYYKLIGGDPFGRAEEFFIPLNNATQRKIAPSGNVSCEVDREPGFAALLTSECTWLQFWFELGDASERDALHGWLRNYTQDQQRLARLKRNAPVGLYDVMQWMEKLKVVGNDSKLSAWLAFGFLLLCLVNTVGLLLAKFSARAAEIGVRRALGASRMDIFRQFVIETAVVGLAGGVLGLVLAFGALNLIGMQSTAMAAVAHIDWKMLLLTFVVSVLSSLLAGVLPTWRACNVTPAMQLKSQ